MCTSTPLPTHTHTHHTHTYTHTHTHTHTHTVLTIGFEVQQYTFSEPSSGSRDEEVCIVATSGQVGEPLTVDPEFTQGTALGECVKL